MGDRPFREKGRAPLATAVLVSLICVVAMAVLRLHVFPRDALVGLPYGMPLLICLWHRDRRILWGMVAALVAVSLCEVFIVRAAMDTTAQWLALGVILLNIAIVATVLHVWISIHTRLREHAESLESANAELASRETEISSQNEALVSQAQELEQQTEELQEHAVQVQRQHEEMQALNRELEHRGRAMQTLLESARWLTSDLDDSTVMARICDAALEVMQHDAEAAAVVERQGHRLVIRGSAGFGPQGPIKHNWGFEQSFASVVMQEGRTAYLCDVAQRPELEVPQPADGRHFESVLASPLRVNGQIVGAVKVYSTHRREWTEEHFRVIEWLAAQSSLLLEGVHLQLQLDARLREAEEASVRKTRFLAAVSHDVRTPANAISLLAELINRTARDPEFASEIPQMAMDLQASARSLIELVSDVLDLARYDSGKLDLQLTSFPLGPVVQAEVRQLMPIAQGKGISLEVRCCGEEKWLHTDRMKLARVLKNLIGNAIKFTEAGGVSVDCEALLDGSVEVRVRDTGVGISPEHTANIFDEFFQLRNPERDRSKGTGLGLAICKRLIDAIGCSLSVESTPGRGATFRMLVPASLVLQTPQVETAADECREPESRAPRALEGLPILLIEDHEMTRRTTARLLEAEGALVLQAENGSKALHLLAHDAPRVVLLDLMLPDMDGGEILRWIREFRPASVDHVVAVSGDVTAARRHELATLGVDEVMAKPVDMQRLVAMLAALRSAKATSAMN